jgi:hypothetical protein
MVYAFCSFAYGTAFKHFHQLVHLGSAFTAASAAHVTNGLGRENKLTIGEHRRDVIGRSRAWAVNRAIFAREIFPRLRVQILWLLCMWVVSSTQDEVNRSPELQDVL